MNTLRLIATVHGRRFKPTKRIDVSLEELKLQDLAIDERLRKPTLPEKLKDQQEDLVSHPPGDAGMPIPKSDRRSTAFSGRQSASKSKIRVAGCSRADRIQGHQALEPNKWLNDEVINFYGALIQKRADEDMITTSDGKQKKRRDIHYFNSFFYEKLERDGYEKSRLARWTKKVRSSFPCDRNTWDAETMAVQINIFSKDIVIFPINIGNQHWVCGALNFKDMRIEYYDSLSPRPSPVVYKVSIRHFCTRMHSTDMLFFQ